MPFGFFDQFLQRAGHIALLVSSLAQPPPQDPEPESQEPRLMAIDRQWDVLDAPKGRTTQRDLIRQASEHLGDWRVMVGGAWVDGDVLKEIADSEDEALVRAARETLRRPVDVGDFILFLDDLLAAGNEGLRGERVWLTPARARNAGIFIHTDDVFKKGKPRRYAEGYDELNIDKPQKPDWSNPAEDGEILGPDWVARFLNPRGEPAMLEAVPSETFRTRLESLFEQLREQGADVLLATTVRLRKRGYLMWGAFILSRCADEKELVEAVEMLERLNSEWGHDIAIGWMHPEGWEATVEAGRLMAEAYDVVYATRRGANKSDHYDGKAVDFTAVGLPRDFELVAPDGATRKFDLSAPSQTRDVNLTPSLIKWIEKHFHLKKLRPDYPHWTDAEP